MNIEAEARSFISKEEYEKLLEFFKKNSQFIKEDYQETFYFDSVQDLRIQKNNFFSKIWLKKGKIHDESREEIEIRFNKDDFQKLEQLFLTLGFNVKIKWFRKRFEFKWFDINVCLDYTKGYGYIVELEKMCSETDKETSYKYLKDKLTSLNIKISSKEEFNNKFQFYEKNWKTLTK